MRKKALFLGLVSIITIALVQALNAITAPCLGTSRVIELKNPPHTAYLIKKVTTYPQHIAEGVKKADLAKPYLFLVYNRQNKKFILKKFYDTRTEAYARFEKFAKDNNIKKPKKKVKVKGSIKEKIKEFLKWDKKGD